jgi:hypothetical protein
MEDDPKSSDISNSGAQEVSILRWKSTKIKEGYEMKILEHLNLVF